MSKLSFRARPLEAFKPMPIYMSEELPDLPQYSASNRAVPQTPSGMKKEEECEHHLQRAIVTGLIIPTPEVTPIGDIHLYNRLYSPTYKVPRQLIHMQPFTMEQDIPDYDMDSEDERWLAVQSKTMDLDEYKFEEMMDRLEKNSGHSVVNQSEAKHLLKENDDDLILVVYDYWLNKRLTYQQSLIPSVRTEIHRVGNNNNNPYLAFRRRTEKMQTRKNRKNDETTYEKMVKLKRDLSRALTLLELVKKRENSKRELLHLTVEVFEKRYQAQDFSGQMLAEVSSMRTVRPAFAPLFSNQYNHVSSWTKPVKDEYTPRKEKRQYKKRKHKSINTSVILNDMAGIISSGDDDSHTVSPTSPTHDDAPFAFRRKRQCRYHAPLSTGLGNWPWCSRDEGGLGEQCFRYSLTSIATPVTRCVGLARRRVGRGGRVILDRAGPPMDDFWASLDFTIHDNSKEEKYSVPDEKHVSDDKPVNDDKSVSDDKLVCGYKPFSDDKLSSDDKLLMGLDDKPLPEAKSSQVSDSFLDWPHFRPKSPIKTDADEEEAFNLLNTNSLSLVVEDLNDPTSELTPIQLNLNELFPSLAWENSDQDLSKRDSDLETITPPSESDIEPLDVFRPTEPINSEVLFNKLSKSTEPEFEVTNNLKRSSCLEKKEYQSGSLLDRWARFESPPPEPVKKSKPVTPGLFFADDLSGCSAFKTSKYWPEPKIKTLTSPNTVVPTTEDESTETNSVVEEIPPHLPPTPPKETKTPPPLSNAHRLNVTTVNGPVNSDCVANSRLKSKHVGTNAFYRKKNNHLHRNHLNNKLIMRLPGNTSDILESAVVTNQVISENNTSDVLLRKSTQVPMEVT